MGSVSLFVIGSTSLGGPGEHRSGQRIGHQPYPQRAGTAAGFHSSQADTH